MRTYEIVARPIELGGGCKLQLFEDGQEVGGSVFPLEPENGIDDVEAYNDAISEAESWLASFSEETTQNHNNVILVKNEKPNKRTRPPRLTKNVAKALAIQELGTAAGLTAHENYNAKHQIYKMLIGKYNVIISICDRYPGIVRMTFAENDTYYDIETLEENYKIMDVETQKTKYELINEFASCQGTQMFKALLAEYGLEKCHQLLNEAAKGMNQ